MYDTNKDGFITYAEMLHIFKARDKLTIRIPNLRMQESPEMVPFSYFTLERRSDIFVISTLTGCLPRWIETTITNLA